MANRILLLVRHGQYQKVAGKGGDQPDGSLTELGVKQAQLVAKRLKKLKVPLTVIHHSTLDRAIETASIISTVFPNVPLQASPLLRECIPVIPKGMEPHFAHIPAEFVAKGAKQVKQTFATFFQPLEAQTKQYELLVAHGNLINYLVGRTIGGRPESWVKLEIQHCGLTEISISPTGWIRLIRHNDVGHLPAAYQTFE